MLFACECRTQFRWSEASLAKMNGVPGINKLSSVVYEGKYSRAGVIPWKRDGVSIHPERERG